MSWRRPALLWVAVAAAGLGLWAGYRVGPTPAAAPSNVQATQAAPTVVVAGIGDALPAIVLPDLHGQPVALAAFKGRPLLINVWASWCAPCVEEMPELARFAASQGADGVQVLGLALDSPEAVQDFLQQVPVDYPIVIDSPGRDDASVQLGNSEGLLPYTVLIDARGHLQRRKLGPFAAGEIRNWVQSTE